MVFIILKPLVIKFPFYELIQFFTKCLWVTLCSIPTALNYQFQNYWLVKFKWDNDLIVLVTQYRSPHHISYRLLQLKSGLLLTGSPRHPYVPHQPNCGFPTPYEHCINPNQHVTPKITRVYILPNKFLHMGFITPNQKWHKCQLL